ncbi:MAG TPA: YqhA family protein [candidate division Zixibacteria bacterium]|nr:YqhA family protein [candidate division Zixibacteria bacterium]
MNKLFEAVFSLRYAAVLAVIAPFFGAVLMLLLGTKDTIEAYLFFFGLEEPESSVEAGEAAMIKLVASIDHFLFSAILVIFAIGLYALFFRSSSRSAKQHGLNKTPSWKHLKSLGGMDEMLLKVIIMLLAVSLLEYVLTTGIDSLNWTVLIMPLTIVALAIGLKWMSDTSEEEQLEERTTARKDALDKSLDEPEPMAD